ncbi:PAS domain-containing sensor histidine kinase [Flavisolibacter tropicus]|uniref:PAS domain-containing sensor histidine kinase n=1 Tax=Flavisolibacter tropicus TaxID=1492898 RepID=UPI001D049407|nr:ATP-binding protein [Flavisolibacter tropicus]
MPSETSHQKSNLPFIQGGGEMGELIRHFNWDNVCIGPPGQWPLSLRITIGNLLNSAFPMFLFWGSELTCFYNDAFRPSLGIDGKHPAIGKKGKEVWPEIWNFIGPLIEGVMTTGKPVWFEDQLVPFYRNGRMEDIYWTFSYSAVVGDDGTIQGVLVVCTETTEKVLNLKKLHESESQFRNMVAQAPVAIAFTLGEDLVVESVNTPMISAMRKTSESEIVGKTLLQVLPELEGQAILEIVRNVLRTGESFKGFAVPIKFLIDGQLQDEYFDLSYTPIIEEGRISGVLHLAIKVTEQVMSRKKLEESEAYLQHRVEERTRELANANKELQRSNSQLEEFAHAASHDLKEPIRKIHFFTDRLKNQLSDKMSPEDMRMFGRVEHASQRMNSLIDDLLLYSHVSQRPHEKKTIDLNEKMKRLLEDLELDIAEKAAVITIGELPVIQGHPRQLQQLFQNLLTNALKYSRADVAPHIEITAKLVSGTRHDLLPDKRYHLIIVSDNGIGFEQEQAEKIFQMFHRLHGKTEYEGTGVGLAIARKVAENHGGKLTAQSEPGKGAIFNLYLPVE